jgi:hypothetical protein
MLGGFWVIRGSAGHGRLWPSRHGLQGRQMRWDPSDYGDEKNN